MIKPEVGRILLGTPLQSIIRFFFFTVNHFEWYRRVVATKWEYDRNIAGTGHGRESEDFAASTATNRSLKLIVDVSRMIAQNRKKKKDRGEGKGGGDVNDGWICCVENSTQLSRPTSATAATKAGLIVVRSSEKKQNAWSHGSFRHQNCCFENPRPLKCQNRHYEKRESFDMTHNKNLESCFSGWQLSEKIWQNKVTFQKYAMCPLTICWQFSERTFILKYSVNCGMVHVILKNRIELILQCKCCERNLLAVGFHSKRKINYWPVSIAQY